MTKICYLCKNEIPNDKRNHSKYCEDYCKDLTYRIVRGKLRYRKAISLLRKRRKPLGRGKRKRR